MEEPECGLDVGLREESRQHTINCDQVSWLLDIFNRYLPPRKHPSVSQERDMLQYGMLYEVMDIASLRFEDDRARWNGTPNPARDYRKARSGVTANTHL